MEPKEEEARRAFDRAKKKILENDHVAAKKFALKAQDLYPNLEGLNQVLVMIDVFSSASDNGICDWYGILDVDPLADDETVKKQYKKLVILLHPDKNKFNGAEKAFKLVSEAWCVLSDKSKRKAYDQKRKSDHTQFEEEATQYEEEATKFEEEAKQLDEEEARRALDRAERKILEHDYVGAKKFVLRALDVYPSLEGLNQVSMMIDVFISASNNGICDWYGILSVDPLADDEAVKKQYKKLAILLHPDKNRFSGAEEAFKLVSEAWCVLSDEVKRSAFDQKRGQSGIQNKEARRSLDMALTQIGEKDYVAAKKFALRAQTLYPNLEGLKQVLMMIDVFISASKYVICDWYGILGVDPFADGEAVRNQYEKLASLLHPKNNRFNGAEEAFKLVSEAWCVLSNKNKRRTYDQKRQSGALCDTRCGYLKSYHLKKSRVCQNCGYRFW